MLVAACASKVSVLERLRAGRSEDATKLLETLLDGDLIGAGALARDGHNFNANARRAVALEIQARKVSGYEPADPNVARGSAGGVPFATGRCRGGRCPTHALR